MRTIVLVLLGTSFVVAQYSSEDEGARDEPEKDYIRAT